MGTFYVVCSRCGAEHEATYSHDVMTGDGNPENDVMVPMYGFLCPQAEGTEYAYGEAVIPR